jgi:S-adenosylmethionine hydrolase
VGGELEGQVVWVDRFGNLVTNIDRTTFDPFTARNQVSVRVGERRIAHVVSTYSDVPHGELCALFGSTGHLEVAANGASAAAALSVGRGAVVRVAHGA